MLEGMTTKRTRFGALDTPDRTQQWAASHLLEENKTTKKKEL